MIFILWTCLMFESFFVFRILQFLVKNRNYSINAMTKIGTSIGLITLIGCFSIKSVFHLVVFVFLFPILSLFLVDQLNVFQQKRTIQRNILPFLKIVLLKMNTGGSFRASIDSALLRFPFCFRVFISKMMLDVVFSQQNLTPISNSRFQKLLEEFKFVDKHPHLSKKRLHHLYETMKTQEDFRHRSKQALMQMRIQSLVLAIFFVMLLGFVIHQYGFKSHSSSIYLSILLFGIGSLLTLLLGDKKKWNI